MMEYLIGVPQAAKRTALGEHTIRRWIKRGTIAGQRFGRDWFLPASEVERLSREYPLPRDWGVRSG